MLSRPTTEQIILDCCRELMTEVLPALSDETAQVKVIMIDTVLRNTAVRAAHEVAWMCDEIAAIASYVAAVDPAAAGTVAAPGGNLHLDAVVAAYCAAGDALSAALETAVRAGLADLVRRGDELLQERADRETEIMAGWSPTGR